MTEIKIKKYGHSAWFEPALWMKPGDINFKSYVVKVNDKTYTIWSRKFEKAYEDDRIMRTLMR